MGINRKLKNALNEIRLAPLNYSNIRNWHDLVSFRLGYKRRVVLHLRNGNSVGLERYSDSIKVDYKGRELKFHYDSKAQFKSTLFFIREQFIEEQYDYLKPKGKVVIDIGANVGDTALYFMANGARRVYALEPNPYFYEMARKNIRESAKSGNIVFENAGAGGKRAKVKATAMLGEFTSLKGKYSNSKDVELLTLKDILRRFKIKKALLKIDCEGCEYGLITRSTADSLKKFDRIVIAHHFNYNDIERKLRNAGFSTSHTPNEENPYTRLIFAER